MRKHRFIHHADISGSDFTSTDEAFIHQVKNVLRLSLGEEFIVCDGNGHEAAATITSITTDKLEATLHNFTTISHEPKRRITLYVSLLKRENFELVVQKATEVGVHAIVPIISARTIKTGFAEDRLKKIILEASEQSGRGTVPSLSHPMSLIDAFAHEQGAQTKLFFSLGGDAVDPQTLPDDVALFIGPEGGWTDEEITAAQNAGCTLASLGGLVLRAETAAICATYMAR